MSAEILPEDGIRRKRVRPVTRRYNEERRKEIVSRAKTFFADDEQVRVEDRDKRMNLFAKIEGWQDPSQGPWEGSSDYALPDMKTAILQTEDDLVNAVMSARPIVTARAQREKNTDQAEGRLSKLLDSQLFVEQDGEHIIHSLAHNFAQDGVFVSFVPWIREKKTTTEVSIFPPIPPAQAPLDYFKSLMETRFGPQGNRRTKRTDPQGWSWKTNVEDRGYDVDFYTRPNEPDVPEGTPEKIEMVVRHVNLVFNGPRVIPKDVSDVFTPARCENLQPKGPSNELGASHVILQDFPTVDEVTSLFRKGWYNLMTKDDVDGLGSQSERHYDEIEKKQVEDKTGRHELTTSQVEGHRTVRRHMIFDQYAFDEKSDPEDMIFWVFPDLGILAKATPLTELYPVVEGQAPRRPLASTPYLPVSGMWVGESLPALIEGTHDFLKEVWDNMNNAGTLQTTPFFFYKPSADINPEIARLGPGDGYPLSNPSQDVLFPQLQNNAGPFGMNMIALATQAQERLTLQDDLSKGRVPQGKSSALRTVGGMQTVLSQGQARPERVLRRFFMGLLQIHELMHALNMHFLDDSKIFHYSGPLEPGDNPYTSITKEEIRAQRYNFAFEANINNSSNSARQQTLMQVRQIVRDPLSVQMGITRPENVFRIDRDLIRTLVANPDPYITEPVPGAGRPSITAPGALELIMQGIIPDGDPMEGAQTHLATLTKLLETPVSGANGEKLTAKELLLPGQIPLLEQYMRNIAQAAQAEQAQQAQLLAAQQSQQGAAGGIGLGPQAPEATGQTDPTLVSGGNELLDESLPSAGGGANPG